MNNLYMNKKNPKDANHAADADQTADVTKNEELR